VVRAQLIKLLAAQHPELPTREIEMIVTAFFDGITDHLAKGGRVHIRGFGSFSTRDRTAQTGRNPRTGGAVEIGARRVPHFTTAKALRTLVADSKALSRTQPNGMKRNAAASTEPCVGSPGGATDHDLPEDKAEDLGGFA
jgi:integration host factor subunit beta